MRHEQIKNHEDRLSPPHKPPIQRRDKFQEARDHLTLISGKSAGADDEHSDAKLEDIKTTPLFTHRVRLAVEDGLTSYADSEDQLFFQYGLLGIREHTYEAQHQEIGECLSMEENLVYANMNAPWSTFVCGSQGGGKSHTLSIMLENALLTSSPAGNNPKPLAGLVFHFDRWTSQDTTQLCEAAYLCSAGIPVHVLVSPSNIHAMRKLYRNMPGLPPGAPRPEVFPLYFHEQQLNVSRLMTLMALNGEKGVPLYMEVLFKILRDMSTEGKGAPGLDYLEFKRRLSSQGFTRFQEGPLGLRLSLLESFLAHNNQSEQGAARLSQMFSAAPGTLTIVDLSCPFVSEQDVCALFTICLSIFMENRDCGRIIAMDEAHKVSVRCPSILHQSCTDSLQFLTQSGEAAKLTEQLTSIIRQQRHLATRLVICTQEPVLATSLLDLCNVAIVHRFNSPAWFQVLRGHLAGARMYDDQSNAELFETIVSLTTGQALVFCPSAMLDVSDNEVLRLNDSFIRVRIRDRVTTDGGRSMCASDESQNLKLQEITDEELILSFNAATRPSKSATTFVISTSGGQSLEVASRIGTAVQPQLSENALRDSPAAPGHGIAIKFPPVPAPQAAVTSGIAPGVSWTSDLPPTVTNGTNNVPTKPITTGTKATITENQMRLHVRTAVRKCMKENPVSITYTTVRDEAALSAGLPADFFVGDKKWTKLSGKFIRDEVVSITLSQQARIY